MRMPDHPGWRLWLSLLVSGILACLLSVWASVKIANANAEEQIRRVAVAKQQATEDQRRAACQLVGNILDAYEETPPTTPAGRNVVDAWRYEYNTVIGCSPKR